MRQKHHLLTPVFVLLLGLLVPTQGLRPAEPTPDPTIERATTAARSAHTAAWRLGPYRGLGSWIDMFDPWVWERPEVAVQGMKEKGVRTIYLETSNYKKKSAIFKPQKVARFIVAAHASNMKVIAWYVPGFDNVRRDYRRTMAAINFTTEDGQTFDGFAMDIEATVVRDISERNARLDRLNRKVRSAIGSAPVLGAITPEAGALYWPYFPYRAVDTYYDVFLPMGYYTYRVNGKAAVRRFTARQVKTIRSATGNSSQPVHAIGGIAGIGSPREVAGFVEGAMNNAVIGGSLYDFPITKAKEWEKLQVFRRTQPTAAGTVSK